MKYDERLEALIAPRKILQKMTPEQLHDAFMDTDQTPLPETIKQRAIEALEERAKEEGYANLDEYMEKHPDGVKLWEKPLTFQVSEEEKDEMQTAEALRQAEADTELQAEEARYRVYYAVQVTLLGIINELNDELVTVNREIMSGKPCVRNTQIPVDLILTELAAQAPDGQHPTIKAVADDLGITIEQIIAALEYAGQCTRPAAFAEATECLADVIAEEEHDDEDGPGNDDTSAGIDA